MVNRDSAGFSIVELILAIVVGVSLIGSLSVIANNYALIGQKSRNIVLSNSYAEGKVEAIRNAGFNNLNNGTTSLTAELPGQLPSPKSGTQTVSTPQAGLKEVNISISYTQQGLLKTYQYSTFVGELGVGQ
jgi:hypothetical protein